MLEQPPKYLPIVEAIIFAASEPINEKLIIEILVDQNVESIKSAVNHLNSEYERTGRSFRIIRGGGGYRFATKPEFTPWVKPIVLGNQRMKLSRAALETISLIVYRQPISRSEIEAIRGVDVVGILRRLVEIELIEVSEHSSGPGKPRLYRTTNRFLRHFGIDSLDELPPVEDITEPSS